MTKSPFLEENQEPLSPEITTAELSRIVRYYLKHVKPHSPMEMNGIYRQLQRLCRKGVTLQMLQTAVGLYAADPFTRASDPRLRKNIRTFFTIENVKLWQHPIRDNPLLEKKPWQSATVPLDRLGGRHAKEPAPSMRSTPPVAASSATTPPCESSSQSNIGLAVTQRQPSRPSTPTSSGWRAAQGCSATCVAASGQKEHSIQSRTSAIRQAAEKSAPEAVASQSERVPHVSVDPPSVPPGRWRRSLPAPRRPRTLPKCAKCERPSEQGRPDRNGVFLCPVHRRKDRRQYMTAWQRDAARAASAERRALAAVAKADRANLAMVGLKRCTKCELAQPCTAFAFDGSTFDGHRAWCRTCANAHMAMKNRENRDLVLRHYSAGLMCCACCGDSQLEFLAVDHIDGNGAEHRRQVGEGASMYRWLIRKGFPAGFQILCHNCNVAKAIYGICPHRRASASAHD